MQRQYAQNVPSGRGLFYFYRTQTRRLCHSHRTYCNIIRRFYVAAPSAYAAAPSAYPQAYTLDSGDKLRVVMFGQEGISGNYLVDAGGNVSLPLVGTVRARGITTEHLARMISARLKQGYVREPHVTVMIEDYRPFFILGEVTMPGQYPFVPNMSAENAIAVAGGFSPRAKKTNRRAHPQLRWPAIQGRRAA
jgi:polysaccharide biosynthesis/export protein